VLLVIFSLVQPAAAQRSIRPNENNVPYGAPDQGGRVADIFLPEVGSPPYPVVLGFHGLGNEESELVQNGIPQIVTGAGYASVSVRYRTRLPEAYADALCALAWVYASAETYGFDAARIALYGVSFGGLTVATTAAIDQPEQFMTDCPHTLPDDYAVAGVVTNAGRFVASAEAVLGDPFQNAYDIVKDVPLDTINQTYQTLAESAPGAWRSLDLPEPFHVALGYYPIYWVGSGDPPHLLIHGIGDSTVPYTDSLDYAAVLTASRVDVQLIFDRLSGHTVPPRIFDREMAIFLDRIFE
jgi:acetyl esterase/lipase